MTGMENMKLEQSERAFERALLGQWSSHPTSLSRQRRKLFWIGLSPILLLAVAAGFVLAAFDSSVALFTHPTIWLVVVACALAVSIGCTFTFCVLNLMSRARVGRMAREADTMLLSPLGLVVLAFLWMLPLGLSMLPHVSGLDLVPRRLIFLLDLLCFMPLVLLIAWLRTSTPESKSVRRRPIWLVLALAFFGLAGVSFFADVHHILNETAFAPMISGLKPFTLRVILLVSLLPLAVACAAVWLLFKKPAPAKQAETSEPKEDAPEHPSFWSRFVAWISGLFATEDEASSETGGDVPPDWLVELVENLPPLVRSASGEGLKPVPMGVKIYDQVDTGEQAAPLWFLMGADDACHPTMQQAKFFARFQKSYAEAQTGATRENSVAADLVLCGQIGSGRTEVLMATALFAVLARGQRVMYVAQDSFSAEKLCDRINRRLADVFLDAFVFCGRLTDDLVASWMANRVNPDAPVSSLDIMVVTPREIEERLFENEKAIDQETVNRLRSVIQGFEVVLIDDFMEMDVTERAHFSFVVNKLKLLLSLRRIIPQFVVVMPQLESEGVNEFAGKLFGLTNFNVENVVTLLPRKCESGWKVVLTAPRGVRPNDVCETMVRQCVKQDMKVVLYRKGISPQQCIDTAQRLRRMADAKGTKGDVRVIARCDDPLNGFAPTAVFYLASLCGDAGVSLMLNMGGKDVAYIEVRGFDAGAFGDTKIIPVLPDFSAVSLRIHHLKSILRFITVGDPMDDGAWSRFGVSLSDNHLVPVRLDEHTQSFVSWLQDKWVEPGKYDMKALWPYLVLTSQGRISNAGFRVDFSTLPVQNDDIFRLGDTNNILLGSLTSDTPTDTRSSMAEWIDGRFISACDLAHAECLVFGRTAEGDVNGGDATNVYTVDTIDESANGYCMALTARRWEGDGTDFDRPVRHFAWTIEPPSVPKSSANTSAFLLYSLPECRGVSRRVQVELRGRINSYGEPTTQNPPRPYSYPAYVSAVVLAPKRLDRENGVSQMQQASVGGWNTDLSDGFSVVLTHLFAGVMRRLVPDFCYYALCPVFYPSGREATAVGEACVWVIQPVNSGRTVEGVLSRCFGNASGRRPNPLLDESEQEAVVDARRLIEEMSRALASANEGSTLESRLYWLRSYAGQAFDVDTDSDSQRRALELDFQKAASVLETVLARIDSGHIPDDAIAPAVRRDTSWILAPKFFEQEKIVEDTWTKVGSLPKGFGPDRGTVTCSWSYDGQNFTLAVGFPSSADQKRYVALVNDYSKRRISTNSYVEYASNDPYSDGVNDLFLKLRELYEARVSRKTPSSFAEFLLAFVQSGLDYKKDPANKSSDWPRFPSEVCSYGGGDCEDSSILYAELLRLAGIRSAILLVPEHAAVGVDVPLKLTKTRKTPICYEWQGVRYVYAETACPAGSQRALGDETSLIASAESIPAEIVPTPMLKGNERQDVVILNAEWKSGSLLVTLAAKPDFAGGIPLAVVCYARSSKGVFEPPQPTVEHGMDDFLGGVTVALSEACEVASTTLPLANLGEGCRWLDVFVCEKATGVVHAHFAGVVNFN